MAGVGRVLHQIEGEVMRDVVLFCEEQVSDRQG